MAEIDIAQEWRRLQELYHDLSEEELAAVAAEGYALTDVAKQALHAEIARRNLKVIVRLAPPEPEEPEGDADFDPANLDLQSALSVESREQAEWVKQALNDAGMPCYFGPDLLEDVGTSSITADRPVSVQVLKNDYDRARWVLREFSNRFPRPPEAPIDFTVRCPKCNSTEVVYWGSAAASQRDDEDVDNGDADETEDGDQPRRSRPGNGFEWSCDTCGYEWQDEGVES